MSDLWWQIPTTVVNTATTNLESKVTEAHDRIKSRKFRNDVLSARNEIRGVYNTKAASRPFVWFEGKQPIPAKSSTRDKTQPSPTSNSATLNREKPPPKPP